MHYTSIRWRIAIPYILLILVVMGGFALYLAQFTRNDYLKWRERQLLTDTRLVADGVTPYLDTSTPGDTLDTLAQHYAEISGARVTIIAPDGTVLGESDYNYTQMEGHRYRPEVQEAMNTGQGSSIRYSETIGQDMLYMALRTEAESQVTGIVRLALPLGAINATIARLHVAILVTTAIMTALSMLLALGIANQTTRSTRQLAQVARQIGEGDLSARLLLTSQDEIGQLAQTFNTMAEQLQEEVTALSTEQTRLSAILEHMADGVIITDMNGQIERINPAAARILEVGQHEALEHSFAEVARHYQLIELWQSCHRSGEERKGVIEADKKQGHFLQAIITPLEQAQQNILVVIQDLTQIRRLETVRRDFISNISHELRTPLASLQLLAETLQDSALEDPEAAPRFLSHMNQEISTMAQLVEELLELSRIESGEVPLHLEPTSVPLIIAPAVERLVPQAERCNLTLALELPLDLPEVLADAGRLQQVISNLVHNAIKFTPNGGSVTVSAEAHGDRVIVSIHDTGVGIPDEDIPRIFERFYKADRARSGGGTGLGLAIAKHLVQAHGGQIWVKSREGQGSTFYFSLPIARDSAS